VGESTAAFELDGKTQTLELEQKTEKTINDRLGIKILQLLKSASGQLQLEHEIDPVTLPRGRQSPAPVNQPGNNLLPGAAPGSSPGSLPGSTPRSIQDAIPSSNEGVQPGLIRNLKR
jgi:hypothetical protein